MGIQTDRIWHISVRMPQPDHHKPALVETFQQVTAGDLDQAAIDGIIAAAKL